MSENRVAWRLGAVVSALALLATGCGGTGEPADAKDALIGAVEATLGDSFAFEVSGELSPAFRDAVVRDDPSAGPGLAMVTSARLTGRSDGEDGAYTFGLLGTDLAEVREIANSDIYLRVDIDTIANLSQGAFDPDQVLGELGMFGLPDEVATLVEALLRGRWIGVTGIRDVSVEELGLDEFGFDPEESEPTVAQMQELVERLEERYADPATFLRDFADVAESSTEGDQQRFEVTVRVHDVIREAAVLVEEVTGEPVPAEEVEETIAGAPPTLEGISVTVNDGRVTAAEFDVGRLARAFPDAPPELTPGAVVILVALSDHGSAEAVEAPEDATTMAAQDLVEALVGAFSGFMVGGLGDGLDDGGAGPDVASDARNLAIAMESYYLDFQTYTDDLNALVESGVAPEPAHVIGICLYEDGQAYVLYVSDGSGNDVYYDSDQGEIIEGSDPPELGCDPTA